MLFQQKTRNTVKNIT